ncbi:MAG TPA: DUF1844 domain-containing protein [Polyangiaceae bacterium]|jgi:hypothetical protein|nr:MAG: hypothetical protein BWY17_02249 [Deltaproteobacteria bacterium ADurb.Bin207]HNS98879.1 DUF1844 domain-containing protein [Polyangiaceae bacterium]HNZ24387.1 DUF1844 domain-containing protein [Polyangiaceae bacterium]HOD22591.1 DUF1844 domain-containing protein [Polyangiaceae bacterium]HOE51048.1 DUF1844 domain-containing protein [Polyangiaceae bacterium]
MADEKAQQATELPKTDFSTFVLSLSHSALVHLGDAPSPDGVARTPNLVLARQTIDLLEILSEKTKGNLTGEEERLLEHILYELRMRFVEVAKEKS